MQRTVERDSDAGEQDNGQCRPPTAASHEFGTAGECLGATEFFSHDDRNRELIVAAVGARRTTGSPVPAWRNNTSSLDSTT